METNAGDDELETRIRFKYGPYFEIGDDLILVAREMAEGRPMLFHSAYDGLVAFFFAVSYKSFSAITILAAKGFGEDAAVLSRSLVENATNLLYISEDPDTRTDLYLEYEYVARNRYVQMLEASGYLDIDAGSQAARERLRDLYEMVRQRYPNEFLWSGKSVRFMADEVGLGSHYRYAYKYFSDVAHAGPSMVNQVLQPGEEAGFIRVMFGPDENLIAAALVWSCDLFWRVLAKNNEVFGLYFEDRLRELAVRMREIFRGPKGFTPGESS